MTEKAAIWVAQLTLAPNIALVCFCHHFGLSNPQHDRPRIQHNHNDYNDAGNRLLPEISLKWLEEVLPFVRINDRQRYLEAFRLAGLE
jgi:hypothetical protein